MNLLKIMLRINNNKGKKKNLLRNEFTKKIHIGIKMSVILINQRVWLYETFCRDTRQYER